MYQWNTGRMCIPAMVILGVIIAVNGSADLNTARAEYEVGKLVASDGAAENGFGYSMASSGDTVVIGAPIDDDNGSSSGSAYVFHYDGSNWIEQAKLLPADGAGGDYFGYSVAVSGNTIVVGAPLDYENGIYSGSAYVFRQDPGSPENWIQEAKLLSADGAEYDYFGCSVAVSGSVAVIGAFGDDDNGDFSGSAYVFRYEADSPGNWIQEAKLVQLNGSDAGDYFGSSVAVSGDTALIGAPYDDDNGTDSGTAYIFQYDDSVSPGTWIQASKLRPSGIAVMNAFGTSVAISGDTALIGETNYGNTGSYQQDGHGAVNVYFFDGSTWYMKATLLASDKEAGDLFGISLALSGDTAVIGAYGNDDNGPNSGSAYLFRYDGSAWDQMAKFIASDGEEYDYLGISVAVSGDMALIGAYGDDDNGDFAGSAYFFNPAGHDCNENGIGDIYDIADGTSGDCNTNDIPDECEQQDDCNNNGIQDICDVAPGGASDDCNGNAIPDECDVTPYYKGFADAVHYVIAGEGTSITAIDVDVDGDLDLIVVTHFPNDTVILLNNGDGTFQPAGVSPPPAAAQAADVKDLNGDGYPDLILLDSESDKVTVRLNNGDGTFGDPTDYTVGSYPLALAIEDMDGDTDLDLVTVNRDSDNVSILLNHGDGTFPAALGQPVGQAPTDMAVADLDGDGIPDLAVTDRDESQNHAVSVLLNHSGTFSQDCNGNEMPDECESGAWFISSSEQLSPFGYEYPQSYIVLAPPQAQTDVTLTIMVRADIDNHAQNCQNEYVDVYLNGVYLGLVFYSTGHHCPTTPDVAELIVDAETYNMAVASGSVIVNMVPNWRVDSNACGDPRSYAAVTVSYQVTSDCNANGVLDECDIAGKMSQDTNINGIPDECDPDCNSNDIPDDLDINNGSSQDCNNTGRPDECELFGDDCNGNIVPDECDIAYGTDTDCNTNHVPDICDITGGAQLFGWSSTVSTGYSPEAIAIGDLNEDGHIDLAIANFAYEANVSILLGDGTGGLSPASSFNGGSYGYAIVVEDFNGDSHLDLAVANGHEDNLSILLGDGAGSFALKAWYPVGDTPRSMAVGDFNGDNLPDLAVANYYSSDVSILLNDGVGGFVPQTQFALPYTPRSLTIGDFNEDGYADLAVGLNIDRLSILLGDGTGSFVWLNNEVTGFYPQSLTTGDFNEDGHTDLALVNSSDNDISILLGDGTGGFAPQNRFPVGDNPHHLAAGDVNTDGHLDLAVANSNANNISVLFGSGGGWFSPQKSFLCSPSPMAVVIGDFNEDDAPDLAVISSGAIDGASILLQGSPPSPDCNSNTIPDTCETDCNGNSIPDDCDIATGTSGDCDNNQIPDECEDCNGNRIADVCDIADGTSNDCNNNGIPDDCDADCNGNGVADDCDIRDGTSGDCNANGIPDDCEDCNGNEIADDCDLTNGTSADCNNNQVPDECDIIPSFKGFSTAVNYIMSGQGAAMAADDVDMDGDVDLIVETWDPDDIVVLLNDGDGRFEVVEMSVSPTSAVASTTAKDLNGDGYFDLITLNTSVNTVSVRLNNGDGTFGEPADYAVGQYPRFLAIEDMDDDGDLDLVTANYYSHDISVLLNHSNGTFATAMSYFMGYYPGSMAVADFDGDGIPDVAVTDYDTNYRDAVTVRLNHSGMYSKDCNSNVIPDECEFQADCNENGVQDICDTHTGTSPDCNTNTVPDECEVDTDSDGIINDCEGDDDNDGIRDDGDDSGIIGDEPCTGGETSACDDNCRLVANSDQRDSDNDLVGDMCDACPNTIAGVPVDDTGCPSAAVPGDMDSDGDVDLADFGLFQVCLAGSNVAQLDPSCELALLNEGNYVDQVDLAIFHGCMSGANIPADPACAD